MAEKKDDSAAVEPMTDVKDLPETQTLAPTEIPAVNSETSGTPRGFAAGAEYEVTEVIQRVADNLPPVVRHYTRRA